jgi:hypothetical protein
VYTILGSVCWCGSGGGNGGGVEVDTSRLCLAV